MLKNILQISKEIFWILHHASGVDGIEVMLWELLAVDVEGIEGIWLSAILTFFSSAPTWIVPFVLFVLKNEIIQFVLFVLKNEIIQFVLFVLKNESFSSCYSCLKMNRSIRVIRA